MVRYQVVPYCSIWYCIILYDIILNHINVLGLTCILLSPSSELYFVPILIPRCRMCCQVRRRPTHSVTILVLGDGKFSLQSCKRKSSAGEREGGDCPFRLVSDSFPLSWCSVPNKKGSEVLCLACPHLIPVWPVEGFSESERGKESMRATEAASAPLRSHGPRS